ncbi:hypothetical protein SAMN05216464_10887 [Mucilaginibacter pineti]|uniref:DUF4935 domain-containing protein n=1 Tax=Mucilaginibacter pineti TaxID=1391627 RepID=A0A1G7EME3_9SPHI|nr:PIN domain-containing protein [Mucilaginibacter pineti]SDE64777.1 hypothetical protein SAMN05216464_10887 [Mucilaginibacter pineti]
MMYIAIDTCVWLELLKVDTHPPYNHFDELFYWLDNKYLTCITTQNMIREWDRHKVNSKSTLLQALKAISKDSAEIFTSTTPIDTIYSPDLVESALDNRIARLDFLFKSVAEVAVENENIYVKAARRNLECLPPNHTGDSYRDTINLLSLTEHLKHKVGVPCIFTTINYKDFSDTKNRYHLHELLEPEFNSLGLQYIFFDNDKKNFARKLFDGTLRKLLPSFLDYLKLKKEQDEKAKIAKVRKVHDEDIDIPDSDFVTNCVELDRIASKSSPTALDQHLLSYLFNQHEGYEKYFLRKLAENGMV